MAGENVISVSEIDSTNRFAVDNLDRLPSGTVVWALSQTKGYGRHKRVWHSSKGGLWFSIVFKPTSKTDNARLTQQPGRCFLQRQEQNSSVDEDKFRPPQGIARVKPALVAAVKRTCYNKNSFAKSAANSAPRRSGLQV